MPLVHVQAKIHAGASIQGKIGATIRGFPSLPPLKPICQQNLGAFSCHTDKNMLSIGFTARPF